MSIKKKIYINKIDVLTQFNKCVIDSGRNSAARTTLKRSCRHLTRHVHARKQRCPQLRAQFTDKLFPQSAPRVLELRSHASKNERTTYLKKRASRAAFVPALSIPPRAKKNTPEGRFKQNENHAVYLYIYLTTPSGSGTP